MTVRELQPSQVYSISNSLIPYQRNNYRKTKYSIKTFCYIIFSIYIVSNFKTHMNKEYDLLLIGAGLFNAIIAREATLDGFNCLVIEKKKHLGGCLFCENKEGINIHKYGPHIFHTSDKKVWDYMTGLGTFNHFINTPIAKFNNEVFNLPFNMNTFHQLWGITTPEEAKQIIEKQKKVYSSPKNLEEQALSLVGTDIFEKLIKGYTEKQWGKSCKELPPFIIKRIPIRFTYDNNYFTDAYQGIPIGGYNSIIEKCFEKSKVLTGIDFLKDRSYENKAYLTVFTGAIDAYFDYQLGKLEYRTLSFEENLLETPNYQGTAIMNYTAREIPYTRIIEHKHFEFGQQAVSIITHEYPEKWDTSKEPYYPINTSINDNLYKKYSILAESLKHTFFCGRLGEYKYYNMDQIVVKSLEKYVEIKKHILRIKRNINTQIIRD